MLKVDLHTHSADDPADFIPHTTPELVDRAAALGFDALAVTLHDRQLDIRDLAPYAKDRGVVLIPGVERTILGRHVLLLNFPPLAQQVSSFDELARLKARYPDGLVVAPHPFFPLTNCLRGWMHCVGELFDAVEVNAFYTDLLDFNRQAVKWAKARGKPLVGSSDAHRLSLLGTTFSLVDAEPTAGAICSAIRHGRVQVRTRPISVSQAVLYAGGITLAGLRPSQSRLPRIASAS